MLSVSFLYEIEKLIARNSTEVHALGFVASMCRVCEDVLIIKQRSLNLSDLIQTAIGKGVMTLFDQTPGHR